MARAALGTRSRIFYKYEGVSPPGSHKPNTAVAQAYYNKQEGRTRLSTETGAGQWGSALSFACRLLGLECKVYMVKISYEQKPSRRSMIQAWGAEIVPSPSTETEAGKAVLAERPDSPGSLGIAISGSSLTSCWMSAIGKSGARSSGPTGWPVPGCSTGCGAVGMSARMLYQRLGS